MKSMKPLWQGLPGAVTYVLVILALALAILWMIPANYRMIFPGQAQQVSSLISVKGQKYTPGSGGVYDTYVNEFKASRLLYVLFGLVRSDVTVEPSSQLSGNCPDAQYEEQLLAMMADSKVQAEAAALHALGYRIQRRKVPPKIDQVSCGVPAAKVLRAGDTILAVDGVRVHSFTALRKATQSHPPGSVLRLTIRRDGTIKHVAVKTLHADKAGRIISTGGHALIGIGAPTPFKFPVKIHITSGNVGGPSAGLAFALGIVQQLERRDITRGNKVAVTGTIGYVEIPRHGQSPIFKAVVGPIGGARQKALAAQAAGAKYFLVPFENYAEALSAHAHLTVIPVHTLRGALKVLQSLPSQKGSGQTG